MEEKIYELLDNMDMSQTDRLLDKDMEIELNARLLKRIKKSAFKKAGLRRKSSILKKGLTAVAAVAVLSVLAAAAVGTENVANAFGRLFSFIPGYAIVENSREIEFIGDGSGLKAENPKAVLSIHSITASRNEIRVSLRLEKKDPGQSGYPAQKQSGFKELRGGGLLVKPDVTLYTKEKKYGPEGYVMSSGSKSETIDINFKVPEAEIDTRTFYTLRYNEYDLSVNFKLKSYESYDSLEEIGPTDEKNGISITAVSEIKDNKLEVELYTVNKSKYRLTSFNKIYNGYHGMDLNLETDGGTRGYQIPESYGTPNNRFIFDISPEDKNMVLNIPCLTVESRESRNIALKIPKEGSRLPADIKVKFDDGTMVIKEVERLKSSENNEYGALRINFTYENNSGGMLMRNAGFTRINLLGMPQSGGYKSEMGEDDIVRSVDFDLKKDENSTLRLKIENPEYFLPEGYKLAINP